MLTASPGPSSPSGREYRSGAASWRRPSLRRLAFYLFLFVVAAAPLPFGSDAPATVALWSLLLGLATCFASSRHLERRHVLALGGVLAVAAAYALVLCLQMWPYGGFIPADPIWMKASHALAMPLSPSVSIVRGEPFYALGLPIAIALSFSLGLVFGTSRRAGRQLVLVAGWIGGIEALYGVAAVKLAPTMLLWRLRPQYVGDVTGTFVNRNTAAAYFGSVAAIWMLFLMERLRQRFLPLIQNGASFSDAVMAMARLKFLLPAIFFIISLVALFQTQSRAGIVLSFIALVAVFFLSLRAHVSRGFKRLAFGGATLLSALFALQIFGGLLSARFIADGFVDRARWETYKSTVVMIADHFWLGTGLGTFPWAYSLYRTSAQSMFGSWEMAHNVPLQLVAELGAPLASVIIIGWMSVLATICYVVVARKLDSVVALAALAMAFIGLTHSLVDFTMQIAGFAVVASAVIACGLAECLARPRGAGREPMRTGPSERR